MIRYFLVATTTAIVSCGLGFRSSGVGEGSAEAWGFASFASRLRAREAFA